MRAPRSPALRGAKWWTYGESDPSLPDVHRDVLPKINFARWTYGESDPSLPDVHRDVLPKINFARWTYGESDPSFIHAMDV